MIAAELSLSTKLDIDLKWKLLLFQSNVNETCGIFIEQIYNCVLSKCLDENW
jgi:hypothetical protein